MPKLTKANNPLPAGQYPRFTPRLRIDFGTPNRLGPGKIDLLEAIGRTGSIAAAGRELGMSYRRAWLLVDQVNQLFAKPAVLASTGGAHGGGAQLTEFGAALIQAFRAIEAQTSRIIEQELAPLSGSATDER